MWSNPFRCGREELKAQMQMQMAHRRDNSGCRGMNAAASLNNESSSSSSTNTAPTLDPSSDRFLSDLRSPCFYYMFPHLWQREAEQKKKKQSEERQAELTAANNESSSAASFSIAAAPAAASSAVPPPSRPRLRSRSPHQLTQLNLSSTHTRQTIANAFAKRLIEMTPAISSAGRNGANPLTDSMPGSNHPSTPQVPDPNNPANSNTTTVHFKANRFNKPVAHMGDYLSLIRNTIYMRNPYIDPLDDPNYVAFITYNMQLAAQAEREKQMQDRWNATSAASGDEASSSASSPTPSSPTAAAAASFMQSSPPSSPVLLKQPLKRSAQSQSNTGGIPSAVSRTIGPGPSSHTQPSPSSSSPSPTGPRSQLHHRLTVDEADDDVIEINPLGGPVGSESDNLLIEGPSSPTSPNDQPWMRLRKKRAVRISSKPTWNQFLAARASGASSTAAPANAIAPPPASISAAEPKTASDERDNKRAKFASGVIDLTAPSSSLSPISTIPSSPSPMLSPYLRPMGPTSNISSLIESVLHPPNNRAHRYSSSPSSSASSSSSSSSSGEERLHHSSTSACIFILYRLECDLPIRNALETEHTFQTYIKRVQNWFTQQLIDIPASSPPYSFYPYEQSFMKWKKQMMDFIQIQNKGMQVNSILREVLDKQASWNNVIMEKNRSKQHTRRNT